DRQTKNQQPVQAAPAPNAPPVVSSVEADASKDKAAEQPKPEQQTAAANEPPPPAKTEPSATPEESQKPADAEWKKKEMREQPTTATPTAQRGARADEEKDRNSNSFSRPPKA